MDYHADSESDGDSISLEIERGDAVIVYGCNERRYSPPANHVTKVLVGPRDADRSAIVGEITIINGTERGHVNASGSDSQVSSPFGPFENHSSSQTQAPKQYQELAEALSHLTVSQHGKNGTNKSSIPVSPTLSRIVQNSIQSETNPPSKNPFLPEAPSNVKAFPIVNPPGNFSDQPSTAVSPGTVPGIIQPSGDTTVTAVSEERTAQHCSEAPLSQSLPGTVATPASSESTKASSTNVTETNLPDVAKHSQNANGDPASQSTVTPNSTQSATDVQAKSEPNCVKNPSLASEPLTSVQESVNARDQSESSFHFPEPPQSAPLVCVPVKEVKFEEPPKHQVVTAVENVVEKLGEIVQITVQPPHTTHSPKPRDEPNVIVLPTYSAAQFQSKAKDEPGTAETCRDNNAKTESKMNIKNQEMDIPADQTSHEEHEHSYGIIGNDDNLSEITLPPLAEGTANHRDHDVGPYNNGQPCHRIRISIDQQSAAPSRRAMTITGLLVVLLITAMILFGVYKFVHKSD